MQQTNYATIGSQLYLFGIFFYQWKQKNKPNDLEYYFRVEYQFYILLNVNSVSIR